MPQSAIDRRSPPRWYWAAPYVAVVLFASSMLALVWLLQQRETEVERGAIVRDLQWAEQTMRRQMLATEEFLGQLGRDLAADAIDRDDFQLRATQHIANHSELANIAWVGEDEVVRWTAPFDTTDWLSGDAMVGEQVRLLERARVSGRLAYGDAYRTARGDTVLEVYSPVLRGGQYQGAIVGVYSVERIVRHLVPAWFGEKYRLVLRNPRGEALAAN